MRTFRSPLLCTSAFTLVSALAVCAATAAAQATSASDPSRTTAYAYLNADNSSNTGTEIQGFAIAGDGSVSALPTTPGSASFSNWIGIGGNYLFVSNDANNSIVTYAIGQGGALSQVAVTDTPTPGSSSEGPFILSFDITGRSVYPQFAENNAYSAYNIEPDGNLNDVGYAPADSEASSWLSFTANDQFAYQSACYQGTADIEGYTRAANGTITVTWNPEQPPQPSGLDAEYCPWGAAAWGNRYVVIASQPTQDITPIGPYQLVVYTLDPANGSLSTTNTAQSAPQANVGSVVNDYAFDPTGRWLAVGGASGIAIFSFQNGVLTQTGTYSISAGVTQLAWDYAGHLIAYAAEYGEPGSLYVFNIENGAPVTAPGSPVGNLPNTGYLGVKPF
jgi:hypothetical protein